MNWQSFKQVQIVAPRAMGVSTPVKDSFAFWILLAIYAGARILQVHPGRVSMLGVVAMHVFPPAIFAVIHGAKFYRWRGILTFVILCLVIGNIFENLGVRTGFPFGHYYFTDVMGPKILAVPIMLGLAYVGMAYLSWTLARLILGYLGTPLAGSRVVTLPLVAALMMVAWDLCLDPVWSTVVRAWIFSSGGAYFGVPISNFAGWYLTVYIIYQLFALFTTPDHCCRPVHANRLLASGSAVLRGFGCGQSHPGRSSGPLPSSVRCIGKSMEGKRHHRRLRPHYGIHDGSLCSISLATARGPGDRRLTLCDRR